MRKAMVVVAVVLGLVACTTDMGAMLHDAGQAMLDAGDAMSTDAAAQDDAGRSSSARIVQVDCDGLGVVTATGTDGSIRQRTTYYANLTDVGIAPLQPDISAVICVRSIVTSEPVAAICTGAASCRSTEPEHLACRTAPVEIEAGHARVACGSSESFDPDGAGAMVATETGERYAYARFVIR